MDTSTHAGDIRRHVYKAGSPFSRLTKRLSGIAPGQPPIDLGLGEPRHPVPDFVAGILAAHTTDFSRYPPIRGIPEFRTSAAAWLDRRFDLAGSLDPERSILPLNGSREGLFFACLAARDRLMKTDPVVLVPNPFYQAYSAGAVEARAEPIFVPAPPETGFLPDLDSLDPSLLQRAIAFYYASPANPQGAVADEATWARLIALARRHDFYLFADECYSEIWRGSPPPGVLAAARATGSYANVVAFNSLSKRSNLAGIRCGLAAGDADFLDHMAMLRNMAAPQVPIPIQRVAAAAFADETHVEENRRLYDAKFAAARRILEGRFGEVVPPGGFFLWLDVSTWGGGEAVAVRLWQEAGVRVVPGGYLAVDSPDGDNVGAPYIRVALVDDLGRTEEALSRVAAVLG